MQKQILLQEAESVHFKEKGKAIHENEPENSYLIISKDMNDFVYGLNKFAFIKQKNDTIGYVVSSNKDMLEDLMRSIK